MEQHDIETIPDRIMGMKRLEAMFNKNGYLICQSTGERIYDFDQIVAIFVPLSPLNDQVMTVHSNHASQFMKTCVSAIY